MVKDLTRTIVVGNTTYNVNAEEARYVSNTLTLNNHTVDGDGTDIISTSEYNGEKAKEIHYVDAQTGGAFAKGIRVPNNTEEEISSTAVLNYFDITENIIKNFKNNALLYKWDGSDLDITSEGNNINSISIVTGPEDQANAFAYANYLKKHGPNPDNSYLAAFVYISDFDIDAPGNGLDPNDPPPTGGIYFGTADYQIVFGVNVSAETAVYATAAGSLSQKPTIKLNLGKSEPNGVEFTGDKNVELGISAGVLPVNNGGTGKNNLGDVNVGSATKLATARNIRVNLASTSAASFNGEAAINPGVTGTLSKNNGGTGNTVGRAASTETIQISNGTNTAAYPTAKIIITTGTTEPSGNTGDIWIKYTS